MAAGEWYADTVAYVSSRGIMTGYAGTSDFGPDDQMVRQDVACMLFKWLAPEEAAAASEAGHAAFKNETGLSDVEDGAYYTAAANWCYQNGVFKGYSDSNKLGVGDRITREQFSDYMMATGQIATDVGTIVYGREAVESGLIDRLGGLHDALECLHRMIARKQGNRG